MVYIGINLGTTHSCVSVIEDGKPVSIPSDDGQFLHRVTSPKHHVAKTYELTLADPMSEEQQAFAIKELEKGVMLEGEYDKTKPAELSFQDDTHATLILTEGKYHQVKRMMAYFGNKVVELHRASIGSITLDGLEKGESRFLTQAEIDQF